MTKGAPTSKPWRVKGTSRKDRSRRSAEKVEEEEVRTEGHATRMVQVACKRLYAQINANFRRGKKQYTRDDKFVQAKLYDIICDEARKLWSQSAVSMVRLNYKHDILANGPRGPAEKGPPRIAIMMTWPWCKLALEVKRVQEKYHYSYQSIRNCFARVSYLVYMGGCHVGLVALFGTKEDMQKADLDLFCTPLGGESVVDIALAKDAMSLFGYGDTKGMNKAQVPWAYQKDLKVNCIMNKFEPTEGFCVRVYHVHPSKSGRFKEKFSDEDRLNKLFAEYAEYEDRQQVLERDDSAFPSGAADDSAKYFSPDDIRKDVDKVDIYLQCGAWDYLKAHEEYKEILKRVEQPAAGDGDIIAGGKRKMPGQNIEFDYLAERLKDRITYTHQEVKPPPPPPETDDLYVAGPSPEEILAAYVANAGKPHQKGSLFEGAPELAQEATEEFTEIAVRDPDLRRMSSVKARQRWRGIRQSIFDYGPNPLDDDEELGPGAAATAAVHEWLAQRSTRGSIISRKGTVTSRGTNRSRGSYKYMPPKEDVTMGDKPEKYVTPEEESRLDLKMSRVSFKNRRQATVASRASKISRRSSVWYLPPKDQVAIGADPEQFMTIESVESEIEDEDDDEEYNKPIKRMSTKKRQAVAAVAASMPAKQRLQKRRSTAFFSDSGSEEVTTDDVVVQNTLPGSLKLSGEFTEELADPTSIEFMELASATKGALEKQLSKELGDSFHAVQITGFKKGSVVAEFVVIMTDDADKKTQKDVAKCIKQAAKAGVAGRTIQADSVSVEEPQSLSRPQSVAPSAEEDDPKKKRKWSVALSKKSRKSFAFIEVPEDKPESPPKPQEEQKMPRNQGIWKSLRMKHTKHEAKSDSGESADESPQEDATPVVDTPPVVEQKEPERKMPLKLGKWKSLRMRAKQQEAEPDSGESNDESQPQPQGDTKLVVEQKEPEQKMPLKLGKWKSLRMKPKRQEELEPESGESTDDSSPETEIPDQERVRREAVPDAEKHKELELSLPILLNKPEDKSSSLGRPKYSPVPVKRMASATSDLPLPEAVYLKRYSSSSIMDALEHGEEHVAPIMLNTKGSKKSQQKPPKIKLLEKKKSPSLSFKKSKEEKKKPKPEAQIGSTEGAPIPPADEDDYLEFIRKDPVEKKTRTEDDQKAIPLEEDDEGSVFNLPILPPPDQPRNRINMAELVNVLAKKQQLKEEEPRKRSVEFKEPEEEILEEAPDTSSPIAPVVLQPEETKEANTTILKSMLAAKKQQLVEDMNKQQALKRPTNFADVANRAMTEFGSSKKKDSVKKDSMKENERKLSKMSLKSSLKRSTKKDAAPEDAADLEAQTATLDLGDSASVQRYELAPYDSAMDTIEHDRDQGLFPVRGNFDSRYGEGTAEVFVDGDWEDHTQPHMEAAPPADMLKNSKPRRVYAASDVSSMIATWSFDPEWGSIDLPPSEFDEEIEPTRPAEIESSMVVPRAETPDDGDEISDRDSVSTDNTEDSRFTVVPFELEPEDKEKMRVKLPGEIVAPVVAKTKKKPGDPADDKGCVIQ
ncbi:microtubule-associated protein futsch-like isoform X2 [Branchiostoma floridae]|uniref:Microtubule-associated protein futsch-like isoform X2 n=1 Tax=Branchiostoma floridae TaxID=7739 RepID=A0A9J7HPA7_BRAFL|nr:microtubule-associated protein futsch-like isoform X2 [Branchiostoma floridae]